MLINCNVNECLRKYRETADSEISNYCIMYNDKDQKKVVPNSKECPLFCEKFWDYELDKEITKHEDVHYISTDMTDLNSKYYNGLFAGLSNEGSELQEKIEHWENKHEDESSVICPYCDYEFTNEEDYREIPYEEGDEDIKCPYCHKEFNCVTEVSYSYTTSKLEEYEDEDRERRLIMGSVNLKFIQDNLKGKIIGFDKNGFGVYVEERSFGLNALTYCQCCGEAVYSQVSYVDFCPICSIYLGLVDQQTALDICIEKWKDKIRTIYDDEIKHTYYKALICGFKKGINYGVKNARVDIQHVFAFDTYDY